MAPQLRAATPLKIVALGDLLTAGYGLPGDQAFPARLQKALRTKGYDVTIVNAGVSGDTTTAGLDRLAWSVPKDTDGVILELGANDALRGVDPKVTKATLEKILDALAKRHIPVLLAGMQSPRNMGPDYVEEVRCHLSGACRAPRCRFLSVLPRWGRRRPQAEPGRRHAPQPARRRYHRAAHAAER